MTSWGLASVIVDRLCLPPRVGSLPNTEEGSDLGQGKHASGHSHSVQPIFGKHSQAARSQAGGR